jgi:hypothetical protein
LNASEKGLIGKNPNENAHKYVCRENPIQLWLALNVFQAIAWPNGFSWLPTHSPESSNHFQAMSMVLTPSEMIPGK